MKEVPNPTLTARPGVQVNVADNHRITEDVAKLFLKKLELIRNSRFKKESFVVSEVEEICLMKLAVYSVQCVLVCTKSPSGQESGVSCK